jgi:hypothetical protein
MKGDRPSSQLDQFSEDRIASVVKVLDGKVEDLVAQAVA